MAAMAKALPNSVGCGSSKLNFLDHCHSAPLARLRGGMDTVQLGDEIQQLLTDVVELKAEVERLKRLVVALTLANANQPTTHEDEDGLTEDEALAPSTAKQPWPPFCKEDVPPPCKEAAAKFAAASSEP